jgi:RNA polymerase subunit RPABC4/transcription elongation factor Spt4
VFSAKSKEMLRNKKMARYAAFDMHCPPCGNSEFPSNPKNYTIVLDWELADC